MTTPPDKPKRWRPRFGLRAIFILTFGAACFCAGWLERQRELNRERERAQQEWHKEEARWWRENGQVQADPFDAGVGELPDDPFE